MSSIESGNSVNSEKKEEYTQKLRNYVIEALQKSLGSGEEDWKGLDYNVNSVPAGPENREHFNLPLGSIKLESGELNNLVKEILQQYYVGRGFTFENTDPFGCYVATKEDQVVHIVTDSWGGVKGQVAVTTTVESHLDPNASTSAEQ
jgi:hypothetical protein